MLVDLLTFLCLCASLRVLDFFFFFSSRRRHTRWTGDWSSDVCSSDLGGNASAAYNITSWLSGVADFGGYTNGNILNTHTSGTFSTYLFGPRVSYRHYSRRSEERRVGKESRFGGGTQHEETRGGENEDR